MSELRLNTDGHIIKLGADNDVSLTHVADTGLLLNSTMKLQFNDASQFIQGSSATVLSIGATDEIDLTATAVDLNGTLNVSGVATFQAAPVFPDGSLAVADLDIDGATDIGAAIVDADLFIVDDGAGGTNRKVTASRLKTYAGGAALANDGNNRIVTGDGSGGLNGEANLSFDGSALQCTGTLTVGVDDTGHDVKLFGATSGSYLEWDESADDLNLIASGIGVIAAKDLGTGIHIKEGDSGASVSGNADLLVLECAGTAPGMTFLSDNTEAQHIHFGDPQDNDIGMMSYYHGDNTMRFVVNASETMRIRDDGEVLIGTTNSSNVKLKVEQSNNQALGRFHNTDSSASATLFKIKCDNTTGGDYISFNIDKAGSSVLNIEGDGDVKNTNNSYGAISDERIKKDITDANSQWNDIKALKIKNYKLKTDDESPTQLGVIAQDLETDGMNGLVKESRPEAYLVNAHSDFGTLEDGTADNGAEEIHDKDGKITGYEKVFTEGKKVKSVKYSVLYMKAIKCLQEAQTKIESLETRVKTLEDA